jgi:cytochrome b subunit of formate dehydrogenase
VAVVALVVAAAGVPAAIAGPPPEVVAANRRCLECHGQPRLGLMTPADRAVMLAPDEDRELPTSAGPRPGLYVGPDALSHTVHPDFACVSCHADAEPLPHTVDLAPASCRSCHRQAAVAFDRGVHADAVARGDPDGPTCATCHGTHDILPPNERDSLTHPLNAVMLCGECHLGQEQVGSYLESVHGRGVDRGGLLVAATCANCHDHHAILPSADPDAWTNRRNIPVTCGRCHLGVVEVYGTSIHGEALAAGRDDGPVCTDCHHAHDIAQATMPDHHLDILAECGDCHDRPDFENGRRVSLYHSYRKSYHGQVTALGSTRAARCSDCHGSHDIKAVDDPKSRLHPDNLVATCAICHENANASFVQFDPHADYRDRARYPVLYAVWWYFIIVMSMAFGFYGLHSLLWLGRSLIERGRHGPEPRPAPNGHGIRRFTRINRVNHAIVIITFFGLTITGLPLLFADQPWAKHLAGVVGGVSAAGQLHRFFAIMLMANLVVHVVGLVRTARERGSVRRWLLGPDTLLPRLKDFSDCGGMFRWFFRGGRQPAFGHWTYWEKFDYWAEIAGTLIIGGSGLLLWFPTFFASFLPGWAFNIAMIVHGYEALLALGFIFTIHFFNAHLRLEKFPVDDVIFTGQVAEETFREERGEEYERLVATGRLDELRVPAPPAWQRQMSVMIGVVAMAVGMTLVALIVLAGLRAL